MSGSGSTDPGRFAPASVLRWYFGGPLLRPICAFVAAVVVSVGPWIVSVIALVIVSVTMQPVMGAAAVEDLRLTVIYALGLAPLIAGPVGTVAARLVRASLEERGGQLIPEIFLTAALVSGVVAQLLAVVASLALGIEPVGISLGLVFLSAAAALLWTSFAVLAALRQYGFLILAFSAGMGLSVACALMTTRAEPTVELLIWSFTAGIVFCVALMMSRIWAGHRMRDEDLVTAFCVLIGEIRLHWQLCLGILFAMCGVWVDKWVFWLGPEGMRSAAGFVHFSTYDSVMFVAHLSMIPSFAAMLLFQDGALDQAIERFRRVLRDRSTYALIAEAGRALQHTVWSHVFTIVFIQAACSAGLVMMAPVIANAMHFSFVQFDLLRVGTVAVFLQSLFYFSCSVLMICNRISLFYRVQILFFVTNLVTSIICMQVFGVSAYGVFFSSLLMAVISFAYAYTSLSRYDYLVFVGENDALYQGDAVRRPSEESSIISRLDARLSAARATWREMTSQ
jgi:polysaccharide biosynthesis protein PelG